MVLKKDETDLNVIFTALNDSNLKERSRALARLKAMSSELSAEDFVKTKEILEKSSLSESDAKLKNRINYLLKNNYKQKEPETVKMDFDEPAKKLFCMECGTSLPKSAKFCNSCGNPQKVNKSSKAIAKPPGYSQPSGDAQPLEEIPGWAKWLLIGIMTRKEKLGIVCLILGILLAGNGFQSEILYAEKCIEESSYAYTEECEELEKSSIDGKNADIGLGLLLLFIGVVLFVFGGRSKE